MNIVKLSPQDWEKYKAIRLEALQSDPIAFAEDDSQIVGMIGTYIKDDSLPVGTATIIGVYVNNKYRGKGIGNQLMNTLIEEIQKTGKITKLTLWVAETQLSAKKLYEKTGFIYGKNKKPIEYNGKRYEEVIMEKNLV